MRTLLVLGGARSGKSRHAQQRAEGEPGVGEPVFIATAQAFDAEMADRIARHRADRGSHWRTVEAPLDLAGAIGVEARPGAVMLVDCLTLWASNILLAERDTGSEMTALVAAIGRAREQADGLLVFVANEVGWGIVPDNALARRFRDLAGTINQVVAAAADEVVLVAAGLPLRFK